MGAVRLSWFVGIGGVEKVGASQLRRTVCARGVCGPWILWAHSLFIILYALNSPWLQT